MRKLSDVSELAVDLLLLSGLLTTGIGLGLTGVLGAQYLLEGGNWIPWLLLVPVFLIVMDKSDLGRWYWTYPVLGLWLLGVLVGAAQFLIG